jgi:hypothetical protein
MNLKSKFKPSKYACSINRIAASEPLRVGLTTNLEAKATFSLNFVSKEFNPKKLFLDNI